MLSGSTRTSRIGWSASPRALAARRPSTLVKQSRHKSNGDDREAFHAPKTIEAFHSRALSASFQCGKKANKISFGFQNCVKLDEHSLKLIGPKVMAEVIKSIPAIEKCNFSNGKVEVLCLGSRVPEWFLHRTTQASINIDLSSALHFSENWGFIFCVIVPESPSIEWI